MAKVLVPLAQGCEELEAVTVIDILRRAGITVVSAGLEEGPVKASRGVVLIPDTTLDQALGQDFDMIVLPGGLPGADHLNRDQRILGLLRTMRDNGKYLAAICAAPKVLASAGVLAGKQVTGYPGTLDGMGLDFIDAPVLTDGKLVTSRGPGTAMDFALELVRHLVGKATRDKVEAALVRSPA
jgi:4-methyl-5(b-hydroxyethyl)-thiazole monophosphate biosynthesis